MNRKHIIHILSAIAAAFATACGPGAVKPDRMAAQPPAMHPDYAGVTLPPNIAAPSFNVVPDFAVSEYQTEIGRCGQAPAIVIISSEPAVEPPLGKWRGLLGKSAGDSIYFRMSVRDAATGQWIGAPDVVCPVSKHPIDGYLVYRQLYPGYEMWSDMGIYQRSLESYDVIPLLENKDLNNQCINCHNFSANDPSRGMMAHVRGPQGGTLVSKDGKVEKISSRMEGLDHGATYPSWSCDGRHIAFSANNVVQVFHTVGTKPIEVVDMGADLIVYDTETHKAYTDSMISGTHHLETFPHWTPDGTRIYFCRADGMTEDTRFDTVRYDLYRVDFDRVTGRFSNLQLVYEASADSMSVSFPRVSPDGRWLMFTRSRYGNFSIWHPEAQLCLLDLTDGTIREMDEVNSDNIESYHSWSSDGNWFVFSSKRLDGLTARPFIASFNSATGVAGRPFALPQESAEFYRLQTKTYNIPELIVAPVTNRDALFDGIVGQSAKPVMLIKN